MGGGGVGRTASLDATGKAGVVVMGRMYPLGVVGRGGGVPGGGGSMNRASASLDTSKWCCEAGHPLCVIGDERRVGL